jgi:hypothetical protein
VEGDEEGSLKSVTMECGRGSRETTTRKCLRWRGPAAVVGGGPILTSVGEPYQHARDSLIVVQIWLWAPDGYFLQGRTGRLTVGRKMRLDSTILCLRGNEYERKKWRHNGGWCFLFEPPRIYASVHSRLVLHDVEAGSNHLHCIPASRKS